MANHCVYMKCKACDGEYCARRCGYTCDCGCEIEFSAVEREEMKRKEQELFDLLPEGWF